MPNLLRSSMSDLIARARLLIADPSSGPFFRDLDIQNSLDEYVDFIRYEPLQIAPTIANTASTNNQAATIFINYFSKYQWWESDAVVQGVDTSTGAAWVVLTPSQVDYINGHFWFEPSATEFTAPTVPGQYPPVFCTGKVYDLYAASADLLEFWGASQAAAYDITVNGQSLRRSQLMTAKLTLAAQYRRKAKPRRAKLNRPDILPDLSTRRQRLLDSDDLVRGA